MTPAVLAPPPDAVARVDALRAGHHADHEALRVVRVRDLRDATVDALLRLNREQGDEIDRLRAENRRLRDDHDRLERNTQDRPGNSR